MRELRYGYRGFHFIVTILTIMMLIELSRTVVFFLLKKSVAAEILFPVTILFLCFLYFHFKTRRKRRLLKKGICYEAKVIDVEYNENIAFHGLRVSYGWSKNMPHPFKVTVRYENEFGNILIDESKLLYYNNSVNPGSFKAKVFVNPKDSKDRYIQLFLI